MNNTKTQYEKELQVYEGPPELFWRLKSAREERLYRAARDEGDTDAAETHKYNAANCRGRARQIEVDRQ